MKTSSSFVRLSRPAAHRPRFDFDLRYLTLLGFIGLLCWVAMASGAAHVVEHFHAAVAR